MIRRFTSAQFVPANAGAKAKNPVGSTLFSTPMVALLRHPGHKILRTCCHESARKRLKRQPKQILLTALVRMPEQAPGYIVAPFIFTYGTPALARSPPFLSAPSPPPPAPRLP